MRSLIRATSGRVRSEDRGLTLIELLISMLIFSIVMGIVLTAIVTMLHSTDKEQGADTNQISGNRVITAFDKYVREASGLTTPGTGASGDTYVEFWDDDTDSSGDSTCYQWRYAPTTSTLEERSWVATSATGSVITSQTTPTYATEASGVSLIGTTPIFTVNPANTIESKEQLALSFKLTAGAPVSETTQFTTALTAFNYSSSSPAASTACTQYGRS